MPLCLNNLEANVRRLQRCCWRGRVIEVGRGKLRVTGLSHSCSIGDAVEIITTKNGPLVGEVLSFQGEDALVLPDGPLEGVHLNDSVRLTGDITLSPDESWLGQVIDPNGQPLDGSFLPDGMHSRSLKGKQMPATARKQLGDRMETGLSLFNTILPIARGQRLGLFAGSGVGKSTLLGKLVLGVQADVIVMAMIGERSREVAEFVSRVLGPNGMKRTVIVAATADQSALLRRRCAWSAMVVAEHFREQGKQVLLLADSLTRFAEAHREVSVVTEEPLGKTGHAASATTLLTSLCERAGPGLADEGDITAIFSVLVAGSDMEEPLADMMRGILDGHIILSREIAERGRFPAVDVLASVSRSLPEAASSVENEIIAETRQRLSSYAQSEIMIRAGLYATGSDPIIDAAIACHDPLDEFFASYEAQDTKNSFERLTEILATASADVCEASDA